MLFSEFYKIMVNKVNFASIFGGVIAPLPDTGFNTTNISYSAPIVLMTHEFAYSTQYLNMYYPDLI